MNKKYKNRKGHDVSGVVRLIHKDKVIQSEKYRWLFERKKIIKLWDHLYGKAIRKAEILIIPDNQQFS